jgi:predicted RNA polymerase sigma factor
MTQSPVVELNSAVAVAMADRLEAGLVIVDELDAPDDASDEGRAKIGAWPRP